MARDNSRHTLDSFIEAARQKHGGLFLYPDQEFVNIKVPIQIECRVHGIFSQRPNDHLTGYGCKKCAVEQVAEKKRLAAKDAFSQKATSLHDGKYTYENTEYINVRVKVDITCPVHGSFYQTPNNHLSCKAGCPKCVTKHVSTQSIAWLDSIQKSTGLHIRHLGNNSQEFRIPGTKWEADGYCEETNTVYEYHGDFWHGHPNYFNPNDIHPIINKPYIELYNQTLEREQTIRSLGYNLVTIWEHEWNAKNKSA